MKTVRVSQVVAKSGTPEAYTLWVPPAKDREFQRALAQHRVMTVHRANVGAAKDYGEIGFVPGRESTLLIFPKSLKTFEGKRVIGINYELLAAVPQEKPAEKRKREAAKPKATPPPVEKDLPRFGEFKVVPREEEPAPPKAKPAPKPPKVRPEPTVPRDASAQLRKEIARAMKELKAGKTVAAYQTLEKALE